MQGQTKLADHLSKSLVAEDNPDSRPEGVQRSESVNSADGDELANQIIKDCYQKEMAEKSDKEKETKRT